MGTRESVASAPTTELLLMMNWNPRALRGQRVSDHTQGIRARQGSVKSHTFSGPITNGAPAE